MNDAYLKRQLAYIQRRFPVKNDWETRYITSLRKTNPRLWGALVNKKLNGGTNVVPTQVLTDFQVR